MKTSSILMLLGYLPLTLCYPRHGRRLQMDDEDVVTERECELSVDAEEEIEFECKAKTEGVDTEIKDKIKFKIEFDDDGLKVKVKYEQETETEEMETETETEYEILFDRIVEYKPSTADSPFEWDESTVVSELLLTDFGRFSEVGSDNGSTYQFYIQSQNGMATFFFTISQGGADERLTANKMKIDFELKDYGWAGEDTYVALLSTVTSEKEVEIEYEDEKRRRTEDVVISFDEAIEGTGVRPFGEFTWAKEAYILPMDELAGSNETSIEVMTQEADVRIDVIATSPDDGSDRIAFSFVGNAAKGASDIYWDPEAGVSYSTSTGSSATRVLISLVSVLSTVVSALFIF